MPVQLDEVVITNLTTRGKGTKRSPIRKILQVYTKEGGLIAENDPSPETYGEMDLVHFARYCADNSYTADSITPEHVEDWLNHIER